MLKLEINEKIIIFIKNMKGWSYKMKSIWKMLKNWLKKDKEEIPVVECDCNDCNCDCEEVCGFDCNPENANLHVSCLKTVDWENLTVEDVEQLHFIDFHDHEEFVDWYKISKLKGLSDDFVRKYKDKIMWKEYNKSYLKKATKEMLKAEGYLD